MVTNSEVWTASYTLENNVDVTGFRDSERESARILAKRVIDSFMM
jgi:hypothetical protein